jgi:hypothetical protein
MSFARPPPFRPSEPPQGRSGERTSARSTPSASGERKKFSPEEDQLLSHLVSVHGTADWKVIAWEMNGRNIRQCRERWKYYLEPTINRGAWSGEEDALLLKKCAEIGTKWSQLVQFFPARTDIDIRNRYHRIQRGAPKPGNIGDDDAVGVATLGPGGPTIPPFPIDLLSRPAKLELPNPPPLSPPRPAERTGNRADSVPGTGRAPVKRIICSTPRSNNAAT